jgi:hypothetical protein
MTTDMATLPASSILVALTPSDVAPAQANLEQWCLRKLAGLGSELREARQNLRQAKLHKWKTSGWVNAVSRLKARMIYYAKIKAAVQAGYLIVPNFDINVFAVKTTRDAPPQIADRTKAQPDLSPPGQGVYVGPVDESYTHAQPRTDSNGKPYTRNVEIPCGYDFEPDLPLRGVKPIILDATARAMALRIFDQIGVVKARRQDPIIVGQIVQPGKNSYHWKTTVSFFIAWWLDPETL